ncbi:hypothetical protein B0J13DRAFT_566738 [Dactylonectria estremocensis]|uniref:Zn(2)-C6 fungal-type domain-containing protein n=1 Tax=Dactylonectria estremocensis TaxID=1079267 RepID=A0A9P9DS06_9HYPO|nr:hypothetical protein B0J13DRAFT_566738 [Dactylonectria estremocensis]
METLFFSSCPVCERVYTQEHSYNRHVKYCYRAQTRRKGRPRSCFPCSTAKAKCDFANLCARCEKKGLECTYVQPNQGGEGSQQQPFMALNDDHNLTPVAPSTVTISSCLYPVSHPPIEQYGFTFNSASDGLLAPFNNITEIRKLKGVVASVQSTYPHSHGDQRLSFESQSPQHHSSESIIHQQIAARDFAHLSYHSPTLKTAATLIVHALYAFPQMMLRRQTFPPFIHPHWHKPCLPEKLASCMSISQLFAVRTPETRLFLWRTINAEEQRFRDEAMTLSAREIQPAVQAMIVYMIMAIIDQDSETPQRGARMLETVEILSSRFRDLMGGYSKTEQAEPSSSWEDWVFAESRRRVACLWFIISCVISIDAEIPCSGCGALSDLPVVSNKTLWEARSCEEWQVEKAFYDVSGPVVTLGELIQVRKNPSDPLSAQKLQSWEAGTDRMAVLLNIATDFVWSKMF